MRPFRKYSATLFALGLAVALFANGYAYAAGKPPRPPAVPIDPAIVYATNGSLAIANADGSNQKIILSNVGGYVSPNWSPDGHRSSLSGAMVTVRMVCPDEGFIGSPSIELLARQRDQRRSLRRSIAHLRA